MPQSTPRCITHRRAGALLLGLALAALPASAVTGRSPSASKGEAGRNFDLRALAPAAAAPALRAEQARAIDGLRAALPNLRVEVDPFAGTTRTLSNAVGFLTGPQAGDAEVLALGFAYDHLDLLGLTAGDLADYEVTDSVYSASSGVTHLYLRQRLQGIPVYNGQLHVNVTADGRILSVNNLFVRGLASAINTTRPELDAAAATAAAIAHSERAVGSAAAKTSEPSLMILQTAPGEARLVWNLQVETADSDHWYDLTVDAVDGRVWTRSDWVASAQYRVYPVPTEAPTFIAPLPPADARVTVVDPQDATASPFGWHDTNGAPGAETQLTSGNNVNACIDRSPADNSCDAGSQPNGGASLIFTPAIDLTQAPTSYQPAAVVNLYYWNNVIHDVAYLYGFDEQGGNFQENNYGNGGLGSDSVNADGQDGAGSNNANFSTPPDGSNPRMQMFLWNLGTPNRDGDLDAGIIAHEYGHGISNRLVGGPGNVSCLGNQEQPGEGLSDWWSLFYTFEAANPSVRGIGTYALFQPTNGAGIRTARYDKDVEPNTNPWTYGSLPGSVVPHGVGEKWAQAYWYAQGRLEDDHGFDPDIYSYTGTGSDAGNIRAMYYIVEGLKNSVCSPGFVNVRDGIIQAATTSYGGADVCLLWQAFADYGLGFSASQGSSSSINDQTPAFDIPPGCSLVGAPANAQICAGTNFSDSVTVGSAFTPPVTMSTTGVPAPANASFSPNPVPGPLPNNTTLTISNTAGVAPGIYSITVNGNGGVMGSDSFDLEVLAGAPSAPGLISPPNGATGVSTSAPLSWSAVAGAADYFVEVDDNAGFGSPEFTTTTAGTSTVATGLNIATLYHWRVTANNACGAGSPSGVRTFTTGVEYCRTPSLAIPDNNPTGATDTLVIPAPPGPATIEDLDLTLDVTHTWVGDVSFILTHVDSGTSVTPYDRPGRTTTGFGCSGDNIDVNINDEGPDGNVESQCGNLPATSGDRVGGDPTNPSLFTAFDGEDITGSWTLRGIDAAGGDTGTINQWCLVPQLPVDPMPFIDGFESGDTSAWSSTVP